MIAPILLDSSAFGAYFLFGGLALATVAVLALYMPETRGRSLENIQEAFSRPRITTFREMAQSAVLVGRGQHPRIRPGRPSREDGIELAQSNATASGTISHILRVDLPA